MTNKTELMQFESWFIKNGGFNLDPFELNNIFARSKDDSKYFNISIEVSFKTYSHFQSKLAQESQEIEQLRSETESLKKAQQWISVDERLPDTDDYVFVYMPNNNYLKVDIDCWQMQKESPLSFSSQTVDIGMGWNDNEFEDVSHWMPLPPAPDSEEKA